MEQIPSEHEPVVWHPVTDRRLEDAFVLRRVRGRPVPQVHLDGALEATEVAQHIDERDGNLVALQNGVGSDRIVRLLVEKGFPVYEIAADHESLEAFYLGLMNSKQEDQ